MSACCRESGGRLRSRRGFGRAVEDAQELALAVGERCWQFLQPLLRALDVALDVRLVRTLVATVSAVVRHRNRAMALLLSELGAYLAGPSPRLHRA